MSNSMSINYWVDNLEIDIMHSARTDHAVILVNARDESMGTEITLNFKQLRRLIKDANKIIEMYDDQHKQED